MVARLDPCLVSRKINRRYNIIVRTWWVDGNEFRKKEKHKSQAMTGLLIFSLAGLAAIIWWHLLKGKEKARWAASIACRQHGLTLMDDTVVLNSVRLKHNGHSRGYSLQYRFDFAKDGILRTGGSVLITPGHHPTVIINTSDGQLIQEIH